MAVAEGGRRILQLPEKIRGARCKLTCVTSLDHAWKGALKGVHNWRSYALRRPLGWQAVNASLDGGARRPVLFGDMPLGGLAKPDHGGHALKAPKWSL
ncbi:hypothetical protein Taro_052146 [Colocasia esculenta]|uniref:Uncharacterized protein n=1 Tax=Colocasia esculenta TaxID=4460 RepID=A0A843XIH4_COLES|nr:hypothetical protein [Colocasia esculenta]